MARTLRLLLVAAVLASTASCASPVARPRADAVAEDATVEVGEARVPLPALVRTGSTVAISPREDALFVPDEDHRVLRKLAIPLDASRPQIEVPLPGAPAQVIALDGTLLVTIREPGLLLVLDDRPGETPKERARVALPADAWGLAVSADERLAIVTSAWTHQVSGIDLGAATRAWSLDVGREPRGVAIAKDGSFAFVTHLVGSDVTRIDDPFGEAKATRVPLPPAPLRSPVGVTLDASLGYVALLSPDDRRLFAPRHALGAQFDRSWFGAPTVDVLLTGKNEPLAPRRRATEFAARVKDYDLDDSRHGIIPFADASAMTQPRAAVYRASTKTILVASEGTDRLVEVFADDVAPALREKRETWLGQRRSQTTGTSTFCGAPGGIALSRDEATAYVFCRSTYDLAIVKLDDPAWDRVAGMKLADDPISPEVSIGRRSFYDAQDFVASGGLGCAGCHPEGRDDGHTWHETKSPITNETIFVAEPHQVTFSEGSAAGLARQTPMLAGRVAAEGPYGWHAQNADLAARAAEGFSLHRWDFGDPTPGPVKARVVPLAAFLRQGLVPPPRETRPLTTEEERGRAIFASEETGCATCHAPSAEYGDRVAYPLQPLPTRPGFEDDPDPAFKTPSLLFVGGTPPYFHDGSARTLEDLVDRNHDRMGKTDQLSKADRAALVAFLKTL